MEEKFEFIPVSKPMTVYTHGGSHRATIPAEIVNILKLNSPNSKVTFFKEKNLRVALIVNTEDTELISPVGKHRHIGVSVSKELAEKLSQKEE